MSECSNKNKVIKCSDTVANTKQRGIIMSLANEEEVDDSLEVNPPPDQINGKIANIIMNAFMGRFGFILKNNRQGIPNAMDTNAREAPLPRPVQQQQPQQKQQLK